MLLEIDEVVTNILKKYEDIGVIMDNFNQEINNGKAGRLKQKKCFGVYAGWNFCGYVWFDREEKKYTCLVCCYGTPRVIVRERTLKQIMRKVSERYGWD